MWEHTAPADHENSPTLIHGLRRSRAEPDRSNARFRQLNCLQCHRLDNLPDFRSGGACVEQWLRPRSPGNPDAQAASETTHYRGMSNNNSTVVNVTDSLGGVHEDVNQLAGSPLEETSYLGNGGPVDHSTITSYWVSAATATRNRTGLSALTGT